jgi:putative ABC transport system substrate-binding protein
MQLDLGGKRLEFLKQAAPKVSRVAVLAAQLQWSELEAAAKAQRVALVHAFADTPTGFHEAFATITRQRAGAIYVVETGLNWAQRDIIVAFAADKRLPAIYGWREFVEAGGLMSYGPDITNFYRRAAVFYRRAAVYLDKILKGVRPADLPVEQPTTFELVINLKIAKALGLTIPPSLLARADQIIE